MYTEEINKIALSSNNDKRLQTFDRITTNPYGTNAFNICESEMMDKKKAIPIKLYYKEIKIINFDDYTDENKINHNPNWPYIPDHPYRILIIGGSGSRKTNTLLNLMNNQPAIDKIYLYAKNPYEDKYQLLIKERESIGLKYFNDPKAFIEFLNEMHDVYENINDYNHDKENKILIVFDEMIADMINNKKLNLIVTELFIRGRK